MSNALANHIKAVQSCRRKITALADDEVWRDLLERVTKKRSLRAMNAGELGRVIDELHRQGVPKKSTGRYALPQARLVRGLWIEMAKEGIVRDGSDQALDAFVARQSNVDSARWLSDPAEARKVIQALKSWRKRELDRALKAAIVDSDSNAEEYRDG
jgi:phage gp16-like protein